MDKPMRYYRPDFQVHGPDLVPDQIDMLTFIVLNMVEGYGGHMGGGFVETNGDGVPVSLRGPWRLVYRFASWLGHVAFMRGVR